MKDLEFQMLSNLLWEVDGWSGRSVDVKKKYSSYGENDKSCALSKENEAGQGIEVVREDQQCCEV